MRSLFFSFALTALVACGGATQSTSTTTPVASSPTSPEQAKNAEAMGQQAVALIDAGKYDEAALLLDRAIQIDPNNQALVYEKAYAFYLKGEPATAVNILEPGRAAASDARWFQLLGNSYDLAGNFDRAVEAYKEGIRRFPAVGYLHYDLGICLANARRGEDAIAAFSAGIEAERTYPSNYVGLARTYAASGQPVMAIVYAESLLALAPDHKAAVAMSGLLMDSYKLLIEQARKGVVVASSNQFVLTFGLFLSGIVLESKEEITPAYVHGVRAKMMFVWTTSEEVYAVPNIVMWQDHVAKAGHYEAYDRFVLGLADGSFKAWCEGGHADQCGGFVEWFKQNNFPGA